MMDQLELAPLLRKGSANPRKRERYSFDFVVNGVSLFEVTRTSEYDMCGSLSNPRFEPEAARQINVGTTAMLTSDVPVGGHRVALFVCAEFDAASELDIGPFEFEWASYLSEIERSKSD